VQRDQVLVLLGLPRDQSQARVLLQGQPVWAALVLLLGQAKRKAPRAVYSGLK
jgi:hypothetical protein